ncbi:MAG TPA: redoxin domain-containing protein [Candidatus Hydrogenedentes bacterium]|nr:redoxin domain-containing protein [Candidatus Hydrogenedentota bacterium]HQH51997.1 redoxin domain-containing protein [Candidatus Hydrogenedentota bacterium]HQM50145.1 redoxin domain-containing protein [Candidatus Hydrogenedentota bacterium]
MKRTTVLLAIGCLAIAAVIVILAGRAGRDVQAEGKIKIGEKMPDFALNGIDGKEYKLTEVLKKGPTVLIFSSQECPYSRKADPVLSKLYTSYKDKGVTFLSIDSHKDTTPEQIKQYAETAKLTYVVLKDAGNKYADAAGAQRTPEVFIVNKDGKLVYHGGPNNQKEPGDAEFKDYVKSALDEILAGKAVSAPEASTWGCTIKRAG